MLDGKLTPVSLITAPEISDVATRSTPVGGIGALVRRRRRTRELDTLSGCQVEISDIYRQARKGKLPTHVATRLAFIASTAAKLARDLQELHEVESIRHQLEALGRSPPGHDLSIAGDRREAGEEAL